jgi:hypothetical protein
MFNMSSSIESDSVLNKGILAKSYTARALVLDSMGLTSYAVEICEMGLKQCSLDTLKSENEEDENTKLCVSALRELSIQLHHFSLALYAGLLDPDASFLRDWLGRSAFHIKDMLLYYVSSTFSSLLKDDRSYDTPTPVSIVEVLQKYTRPMFEGHLRLFQECHPKLLLQNLLDTMQQEGEGVELGGSEDILNQLTALQQISLGGIDREESVDYAIVTVIITIDTILMVILITFFMIVVFFFHYFDYFLCYP